MPYGIVTNHPVAYVAGPYRNSTEGKERAKRLAKVLWRQGYAVICPHTNSLDFEIDIPNDKLFLDGYLELLTRCDVMYVIEGWRDSEGTLAEIELAEKLGIPVEYVRETRNGVFVSANYAERRVTNENG